MDKKKIHMIGNTHIDSVWLWNRAEGMRGVLRFLLSYGNSEIVKFTPYETKTLRFSKNGYIECKMLEGPFEEKQIPTGGENGDGV